MPVRDSPALVAFLLLNLFYNALTMVLPQDPRVPGTSRYDREEVVAVVTDFYRFLAKLPYIEPAGVIFPPASGWSNINKENFASLDKSDEVIELLKHLPYINMSGHEYLVAPDTYPCDYRREPFQSPFTKTSASWYVPTGYEFPTWVIPLTYGKRDGTYLMLDTTDGTVSEYRSVGDSYPPHYESHDPRSWRDHCNDRTSRLTDFLSEWKKRYQNLEWIALPMNGWPNIWVADDYSTPEEIQEIQEMREIYYAHGWPDSFRRNECKLALGKWERSRHQNWLQAQERATGAGNV